MEISAAKVRKTAKDLDSITETERPPTVVALERKLAAVTRAWEEFETSYGAYVLLVFGDQGAAVEQQDYYDTLYDLREASVMVAEEILADTPRAECREAAASESKILGGRLKEQEAVMKAIVVAIKVVLDSDNSPSLRVLAVQTELLGELQEQTGVAGDLCSKMIELDPAKSEEMTAKKQVIAVEARGEQIKLRNQIAALTAVCEVERVEELRPQDGGSNRRFGGPDRAPPLNYFEKRPFPKFSGAKRDYPSFRKEWKQCVTPNFKEEFQLREILRAVPKYVEPDLKNIKDMSLVWAYMDEEFGQEMEICSELVANLTSFKFSAGSKSESDKFAELHRKWNEVYADLEEIGKVEVLNHEPTLMMVCQRLPSATSRDKFIDHRMQAKEEGDKNELEIMVDFMAKKRQRQKARQKLDPKAEVASNSRDPKEGDGKSGTKCFNCQKLGHCRVECLLLSGAAKGRSATKALPRV